MNQPCNTRGAFSSCELLTTDIDATVKLAVELGGKICLPPQDIPQVGRFSCGKTRKAP